MPPNELSELLAKPLPKRTSSQLLEGFTAPIHGFGFLARRPALWRYAAMPVLMNLLITAVLIASLIFLVTWFVRVAHPWFVSDHGGFWRWVSMFGEFLFVIVLLAVAGAVVVVIWKVMTAIFCGYFYGKLAERVEVELGISPHAIRSIPFIWEVVDTLVDLGLLLAVNVVLLAFNSIPLVGTALVLLINLILSSWILGLDFLAIPLALRGKRRWEQFRFGRRYRAYTIGLGSGVFVCQLLPIVGAVLLTSTTVGAVLLHRRLESDQPDKPPSASGVAAP